MREPRVLIANRGEIAVRVIRTCREMGIGTIAVYSDVDRNALHVEMADEAYHVGPPPPLQSYLSIPAILEAGRRGRATMVHPGYGFLAERADFARAAAQAGMRFIGPSPDSMAMLGDKIAARQAAVRAGAPVVPGTEGPVSPQEAVRVAPEVGYPLVVKAAFGGGGKGMRLVESAAGLEDALERSAREATAYFGRPEIYLERYIAKAHHVEAQIIADRFGNVSFLGERDCSSQRRYQKLVEESPSPVVDADLRARLGEAATAIVREAGYANAGTVEFLVEPDGSFYFMEVNARLQVEHPVTEMVTGLDLVRWQILVTMGERVELAPALRGHAIECRLNAEDPYRDFHPGPGAVLRLRPPGGSFVRLDAGVTEGREVSGQYDSLFAKLIVWAEDRELARRRMLNALEELELSGIPSTIPFHQWLLETQEFRTGTVHTRFVEEALGADALRRPEAMPERAEETAAGSASPERPVRLVVEVGGRRVPVRVWGEALPRPPLPPVPTDHAHAGSGDTLVAEMQGTILDVLVTPGQEVEAGSTVCILEAMKMENRIVCGRAGRVAEVFVARGDVVDMGQPLVVIEQPP